ncbi:S1 family peptidase, partial [Streptomyces sp. TRM76130]|nr:S1 family peptidase [Streptomyces sp. TRM76130]
AGQPTRRQGAVGLPGREAVGRTEGARQPGRGRGAVGPRARGSAELGARRGTVLVRGSAEAPVGASVCRSGSTTHWHCGTVLARNETLNYLQGVVHQMTKTSVCTEGGCSGGSSLSGDQAQGVTSGRGNCTSGGETWFQPVNEIPNRRGLTLHTA